jgi:streptogramin lyase
MNVRFLCFGFVLPLLVPQGVVSGERRPEFPLSSVPDRVLLACERAQGQTSFRLLCPTRLPVATRGSAYAPPSPLQSMIFRDRKRVIGVEFVYGAPYNTGKRRNNPARFLHLAVLRGNVAWARPPNGSTSLGARVLGGREGQLFEAPSYLEGGGYHGDHLIFDWREKGSSHTISLHSWNQQETLELLEQIMASLRPAAALSVEDPPAEPQGSTRARFADASALAAAGHTAWVAEYYEGLHRVDLGSGAGLEIGKTEADPIRIMRFPEEVAVSSDAVWVVGFKGHVERIAPDASKVTKEISTSSETTSIEVGERYVWAVSHADGTLFRIDPSTNEVVGPPIPVGSEPSDVAAGGGAMWITSFGTGSIIRVAESTGEVVARIQAGKGLGSITTTSDGVWSVDWKKDALLRIDPTTNELAAEVDVGPAPSDVVGFGDKIWVSDYWDGTIRGIDPETNEVTDVVEGLDHPIELARSDGGLVARDGGAIIAVPIETTSEKDPSVGAPADGSALLLLLGIVGVALIGFTMWFVQRRSQAGP